MFNGAEDFNQDLNSWTTSSVTTMTRMFQHAFKFNGAIGNWDTSEVKDMNNMFTAWTVVTEVVYLIKILEDGMYPKLHLCMICFPINSISIKI